MAVSRLGDQAKRLPQAGSGCGTAPDPNDIEDGKLMATQASAGRSQGHSSWTSAVPWPDYMPR